MTLDEAGIVKLIEGYDNESKALKEEALRLCWHMRGGLTYTEAMQIGLVERKIIGELIKEHIETTKKSGLPFF